MKKKIVDPAFRNRQQLDRLAANAFPSKQARANLSKAAEEIKQSLPDYPAEHKAELGRTARQSDIDSHVRSLLGDRGARADFAAISKAKNKPLKEYYKTRLSHRLDEGRFTRALGNAARQTGRAIRAVGGAAHAGGMTATQYTGKGMARLGRYMATNPRQAFNRGLAATAAAGLVYGGYQLGKNSSGPQSTGNRPAMKGVPSGRGGAGVPDDTISPVRPGHSRKGPEVAEP